MTSACVEAGKLLCRVSKLGAVQADAARDLTARVLPIVGTANEKELRDGFLPPLLFVFGLLADAGEEVGTATIEKLNAAQGVEPMREAIADVFRKMAGMGVE